MEEVEQGGEEGVLRLAAGAARITVGCTGSEVGKHISSWEGRFLVATSGDLGSSCYQRKKERWSLLLGMKEGSLQLGRI